MNNKLFFSLTIVGTILMLMLLFSELQVVDAEQPLQGQSESDMYQTAINQLKSLVDKSNSENAQANLDNKIQALEYKQNVQATAMAEPQKSLEEICNAIQLDENIETKQFQPDRPQGILDVDDDFLGMEGFLINNIWRGEYSGFETEIYAGNLYAEDQKGLLILNISGVEFITCFLRPQPEWFIEDYTSGRISFAIINHQRKYPLF